MDSSPSYQQMQELQQNLKEIQQQLQLLFQQRTELEHLTGALQELGNTTGEQEVLIPLGAGIFIKASIKDVKTILLNVGAEVIVEKNVEDTLQLVERQNKELQTIESSMQEELAHVNQQLQYLQLSQMQQKE